jgi:hypothetical protein
VCFRILRLSDRRRAKRNMRLHYACRKFSARSSSSNLGTATRNNCCRNSHDCNKATHTHDNTASVRSYFQSLGSQRLASHSTEEFLAFGSPPQIVWKGRAGRATLHWGVDLLTTAARFEAQDRKFFFGVKPVVNFKLEFLAQSQQLLLA